MRNPAYRLMRRLAVPVALLAVLFSATASHAAATSTVRDLGTLGGGASRAWGINDRDQVVGESETADGRTHAFLWSNGQMTDLGTLGGPFSRAADINNRGQVVGTSMTAAGDSHAFLWENGVMHDLGAMAGTMSSATAINNQGQIVGSYQGPGMFDLPFGFVWRNGQWSDLGSLPGGCCTDPRDINDTGQIAGLGYTALGQQRAVRWQAGVLTNLGTLGGGSSYASGINNRGQVVGGSWTGADPGVGHGFLWQDGVMTDLGVNGISDINDQGQIAGMTPEGPSGPRAFVSDHGVVTELPTLGGPWGDAAAINNLGHAAGISAINSQFTYHAALWMP